MGVQNPSRVPIYTAAGPGEGIQCAPSISTLSTALTEHLSPSLSSQQINPFTKMRVSVVVLLSLAVALVALAHAAAASSAQVPAEPLPVLYRARRDHVDVEVDHPKGGKTTGTVNGESTVWRGDRDRRVDVHGSADTRGNRRAGVSYKW
ncbi:tRNA/tmRNA (uracil-C(5))-methyltransferase [Frankliniella fusca]|uniref:tRNA/tmRNA (Uracil-C(5))-methyltransferase n=1 Tax=Frankliniella fusca TaxID=407009 RepID=A0AAE1LCM3_9NEOP|nr:tRNA/tmRNA (uracil-C(5))-methyltransferase [Frankliniella fusca]